MKIKKDCDTGFDKGYTFSDAEARQIAALAVQTEAYVQQIAGLAVRLGRASRETFAELSACVSALSASGRFRGVVDSDE